MPPTKKLYFLSFIFFSLFSLLIIRFYQIQIVEHDKWTQQALAQHQTIIKILPMRGSFYSNSSIKLGHPEDPQPFVIDVPKFHLFVDPLSIPPQFREELIGGLNQYLGFSASQKEKVAQALKKKSRSRKIATWLSREERQLIESWWKGFAKSHKIAKNGLFFTSEFKRSYPFGASLGAVLHTVQDEKDPKTQEAIPTGGLELMFHSYLQGKEGRKQITHSPSHSLDTGRVLETVEHGADIYLTINHYLQAIVETELKKGVEAVSALGGWAVMMDPWTGEIFALAQEPAFDPTRYSDFFNDPKLQDRTRVKALTDCYEPGSIFKPITLAVCLLANQELKKQGRPPLFTPEEKIPCSNGWFPGRSTPLKDARVHSYLNMDMALQKSSNIYMAYLIHRLIETMGEEWYRQALATVFGLGQKTNVELPGESGGLLPTPGKLHPNGKLQWSLPTPYSLAIGHNVLVNAMQMVRSYAIFANGGKQVQPHLVRKIVKDGKVIADYSNYRVSQQLLDPEICKRVVRAMKF
ncbi:MAG: penicillin-binding protein 2, partial [Chlamydiia bacterium]|nr:penicillin-binding protein 2 [Chlamydiia bacterium]